MQQLNQVFFDNFAAYYRAHVAHVNITGRNFYSDHKLLGKIYQDLQADIDVLAELLRSLGDEMPADLGRVVEQSNLAARINGDADQLLQQVEQDLQDLRAAYAELYQAAEEEDLLAISNHAQDRVQQLEKFIWMLQSSV